MQAMTRMMRRSTALLFALVLVACGSSVKMTDPYSDGEADPGIDAGVEVEPDTEMEPVADPLPDPAGDPRPEFTVDIPPDPVADTPSGGGCSSGTAAQVFAGGDMVGCAGTVHWSSRDTLCSPGWSACSAAEWVSLRGGVAPTHNFWTSDALHYFGYDPGVCGVTLTGGGTCDPHDAPMRVCAGPSDPDGNECNWFDCGYESFDPNEFFGGCNGNLTAGTLCCR